MCCNRAIPLDWDGSPLTPKCKGYEPKPLSPEEIAELKAQYGTEEYHRYYEEWWEHYEKMKEKYDHPIECEDGTVIQVDYI